jgi:hypothetical protein
MFFNIVFNQKTNYSPYKNEGERCKHFKPFFEIGNYSIFKKENKCIK